MTQTDTIAKTKARLPRLEWVDVLRVLCALEIAGHHWLRACMYQHLFTNARVPDSFRSFLWDTRPKDVGFAAFRHFPSYFQLDSAGTIVAHLNNFLGYLFNFGWEAVNIFILVSGFSLAFSQPDSRPEGGLGYWLRWYRDRLKRILLPYYLVVISVNLLFLLLQLVLAHTHSTVLSPVSARLNAILSGSWLDIWASSLLLVDPIHFDWTGHYLFAAWWFLPAIMVAYVLFPLLLEAQRRLGNPAFLLGALVVSGISYALEGNKIGGIQTNALYHIVTLELFTFCLGISIGRAYRSPEGRARGEAFLTAPGTVIAGVLLVLAGNFAGLFIRSYPLSSALFTPGLLIVGSALARAVLRSSLLARIKRIDAYMFYLCHQPTAYAVSILLSRVLGLYTTSIGLLIFLPTALGVTLLYVLLFNKLMSARKPAPAAK